MSHEIAFQNVRKLIDYSEKGIVSKQVLRAASEVTLFCMAKDTEISDHTSAKEGIVFVIEGKGIFRLEGKDIEMRPGVLIHMKKNAVHSLKAEENTSFLLILNQA